MFSRGFRIFAVVWFVLFVAELAALWLPAFRPTPYDPSGGGVIVLPATRAPMCPAPRWQP
jgi:hypothetical protein